MFPDKWIKRVAFLLAFWWLVMCLLIGYITYLVFTLVFPKVVVLLGKVITFLEGVK